MPTQMDIARLAGVSQATVSLVLNPTSVLSVSDESRKQVLDACRRLGYEGDARGRRNRICLLCAPSQPNHAPVYEKLKQGIAEAAKLTQTEIVTCEAEAATSAEDILLNLNCDGIISYAGLSAVTAKRIQKKIPTVLVNRHEDCPHSDRVVCDEANSVAALVEELLKIGHRRVAFMGLLAGPYSEKLDANSHHPIDNLVMTDRVVGYVMGLIRQGLPVDDTLIQTSNKSPILSGQEWVNKTCVDLLALPNPPTAIIGFNDALAIMIEQFCLDNGISIPQQLSIAGFDDNQFISKNLTTIDANLRLQGRTAFDLLLSRVNGTRRGPPATVLCPGIVSIRSSFGPAPKKGII